MGTLQTELMKLTTLDNLTFDDDPAETPTPPIVQETTVAPQEGKTLRQQYWEWLREHPGSTAKQLGTAVGLPQTEACNILYRLMQRGIVVRSKSGGYFQYQTVGDEYPVMTAEEKVRRMNEARHSKPSAPYKSKRVKHAQAEKTIEERKAELRSPGVTNGFMDSVQGFINQLTVHQAKAVYVELRKVFGG